MKSSFLGCLCLDLVLASEHVIHLRQVVRARSNGLDVALGGEVLLQVGMLPQEAHLNVIKLVGLSRNSKRYT